MDVAERVYADEGLRNKLLAWLNSNGVNGHHVPIDARPSLADGQLTIEVHTLNEAGRPQIDPADETRLLTHSVTVPVIVQPDADVQTWLR